MTVKVKEAVYEIVAVKPYPNAKKRICDNLLLQTPDGKGKHWLADFAVKEQDAKQDQETRELHAPVR